MTDSLPEVAAPGLKVGKELYVALAAGLLLGGAVGYRVAQMMKPAPLPFVPRPCAECAERKARAAAEMGEREMARMVEALREKDGITEVVAPEPEPAPAVFSPLVAPPGDD